MLMQAKQRLEHEGGKAEGMLSRASIPLGTTEMQDAKPPIQLMLNECLPDEPVYENSDWLGHGWV